MRKTDIKAELDKLALMYNQSGFIHNDPICIPHRFSKPQDIEISGFFAALLAWGTRTGIINSASKLMALMDNSPHDFIINHQETDRKNFEYWVHRTFQYADMLYFLEWLQYHYQQNNSLESAFNKGLSPNDEHVGNALIHFHHYFFSLPHLSRTHKHLQTPERKSACKRLNLFLRWMVRKDTAGVDFGLWNSIKPSQLICPLDVHVHRTATQLKLISRKQADWQAAIELTYQLKKWNAEDPVLYDFALFGWGIQQSGKQVIK